MKFDVLLYESGIVILIAAIVYMGLTLKKLTAVVKEKKLIWTLPIAAALILAVSLGAHVVANFKLLPELSVKISEISSSAVMADQTKTETLKMGILALKNSLTALKTVSFSAFLLASILLLVSTAVYIRWISK